jgi:hypothetical protein
VPAIAQIAQLGFSFLHPGVILHDEGVLHTAGALAAKARVHRREGDTLIAAIAEEARPQRHSALLVA